MARRIAAALAAACFFLACTTDPYTGERKVARTAIGAGIGAAAGAGVGALVGGHSKRGRSALIGAGVGALAGGAVGAYMDVQEAKLRRQLEGTGVNVTRVGDNVVLNMPGNVTFDVDSAALRPEFYPVLNSVARVLTEYQQTLVHVSGHTDSTGTRDYNLGLSQRRAETIGSYLKAQGVLPARVATQGFGPDLPVAPNTTAEGRQQNRRVELTLEPLRG